MTSILDRVRNSDAFSDLNKCKTILDELSGIDWDKQEVAEFVTRSNAVVEHLLGRLAIVDVYLVPLGSLDALHGQTQGLVRILEEMKNTQPRGPGNLDVVHRELDTILEHATALPSIPIGDPDDSLLQAAEQYHRSADQAKDEIAQAVSDAKHQFDKLAGQIAEKGSEFDSASAGHKANIEAAEAGFRNEMQQLVARTNAATERLGREVTSIQETFRQSQGTRSDEFQEAQATREQQFRDRVDSTVSDVESYRDQARSMLEEVAGAGTAEHYARQHSAQRHEADIWRKYSVFAFGAITLTGIALFVDFRLFETELSIAWVLARSPILLTVAAFTAFAVKQSANHRRREEEMARVSSELQLLWPFVNRLPENDRQALLREVSPQYFRGGLSTHDDTRQGGRKLKRTRDQDRLGDSTSTSE